MGFRWSGKRVRELLEELSDNQKNFKTEPSGRPVKTLSGGKVYPNGYFRIDGAYGGYKLAYVIPYTPGAETDVTSGFIGSGELAEKLLTMGAVGLKYRFKELQKRYKQTEKEFHELERKRAEYIRARKAKLGL